jgi:polar amino acid transport system substrate-binding protein
LKNGYWTTAVAIIISAVPAWGQAIPELKEALPEEYRDGIEAAVFNDWPPDEFVENGQLVGWSVDIAREIEERLGVPFNYVPTSFDAIIPALIGGRFDAGFASFGSTPERLKQLDFVAQRKIGTAFGIPVDSDLEIAVESDACGHSIAVIAGAWDHQLLEQLNQEHCIDAGLEPVDIQGHQTQNAAELAVRSGRAEATFASSAKMAYLAQQTGDFRVSELVLSPVYSNIGVRKDDPLGQVMADAIQSMIEDGTYEKIMAKWNLDDSGMLDRAVLITEENPEDTLGQ